jgi:chemotaxis protein CheX
MHYPEGLVQSLTTAVGGVLASCEMQDVRSQIDGKLSEEGGDMFSASLGFAGMLQGALIVCARANALSATNPQRTMVPSISVADNADWIGEIANQVVGGLKREVSRFGVNFQLATPTVVHGKDLSVGVQGKGKVFALLFESRGLQWKIYFSCEIAEGLDFNTPKADAQVDSQGGDSFLF